MSNINYPMNLSKYVNDVKWIKHRLVVGIEAALVDIKKKLIYTVDENKNVEFPADVSINGDCSLTKLFENVQHLNQLIENIESLSAIQEIIDNISTIMDQIDVIESTLTNKSDVGHKHTISDITDYIEPDLTPYAKSADIANSITTKKLNTNKISLTSSDNNTWVDAMEMYAPNLTNGNHVICNLGKKFGKGNSGHIGYKYSTKESECGLVFGLHSYGDIVTITNNKLISTVPINVNTNKDGAPVEVRYQGTLAKNKFIRYMIGDNVGQSVFAYGHDDKNTPYLYIKLYGKFATICMYSNSIVFNTRTICDDVLIARNIAEDNETRLAACETNIDSLSADLETSLATKANIADIETSITTKKLRINAPVTTNESWNHGIELYAPDLVNDTRILIDMGKKEGAGFSGHIGYKYNTTGSAIVMGLFNHGDIVTVAADKLTSTVPIEASNIKADNETRLAACETTLTNKSDVGHTHTTSEITDMGTSITTKALNTNYISLTPSGNKTWVDAIDMYAPNLTNGNHVVINIGKVHGKGSCGYIGYKYSTTESNSGIVFGLHSCDDIVTITNNKLISTVPIEASNIKADNETRLVTCETSLTNKSDVGHKHTMADITDMETSITTKKLNTNNISLTSSDNVEWVIVENMFAPNLTDGNHIIFNIGKKHGKGNSGHIGYKYSTKESECGLVFGLFSCDDIVTITNNKLISTVPIEASNIKADNETRLVTCETSLTNKSDVGHTHSINDVIDLQTTLDNKANIIHTHSINDIIDLQTTLDNKSDVGHKHSINDVIDYVEPDLTPYAKSADIANSITTKALNTNLVLSTSSDNKAWVTVMRMYAPNLTDGNHIIFNIGKQFGMGTYGHIGYKYSTTESESGLVFGFNGYGDVVTITNNKLISKVPIEASNIKTDNETRLAAVESSLTNKSDVGHTHSINDVIDLQTNLDNKANVGHTHTTTDINDLETLIETKINEAKETIIDDAFKAMYPIGSIYITLNSLNDLLHESHCNADAHILYYYWHGCKWEYLDEGVFLRNGTTINPYLTVLEENGAGETGGEAEHTLTVDEMPSHNHAGPMKYDGYGVTSGKCSSGNWWETMGIATSSVNVLTPQTNGGDKPHNNLPPYLTVYMYKRIA